MALLQLYHFLHKILFILRLATMNPCKGDTPIIEDNKGWTWEPALWMTLLVFIYVYRLDINIERLMPCSKNITCTWKIYLQVATSPSNEVLSSASNKVWQVLVASTIPCTIWSSVIFELFFIDAFNWKFVNLFWLTSFE